MMATLSIRQKIGQLMVCGFQGDQIDSISDIKNLIETYHIGGLILFGRNIGTPQQVLEVTTSLQKHAKTNGHDQPLLISIDQENGMVRRLGEGTTPFPGAMLLAATDDDKLTYEIGKATARELRALGINWNFAPVVDINNNPENPVIGVRSFGETAKSVSRFAKASMKGMQAEGVITTLKHFPGHGDTHVDSHLALPVITHPLGTLDKLELVPFKECIADGADTIMTAHVYFPGLEAESNRPATMSHKVITGLLREKLGFDGVVTTDCMEMKAIADTVGTAKGAVEAIKAGVDLIMISHLPSLQVETIERVVSAVESGEISESRINESYLRVQKLKEKYLSWSDYSVSMDGLAVPEIVGCEKHHELAEKAFRKGITIVKNEDKVLPLKTDESHKIMVVYPSASYLTLVEEQGYSRNELGMIIQDYHPSAKVFPVSTEPSGEEINEILKIVHSFDTIIIGTLSAQKSSGQKELLRLLLDTGKSVIVLAMRNPYDLAIVPNAPAFVTTYEFTSNALRMAVKAIFGEEEVTGKLPISLPF
ncbi:beta-N-acetylhexosaminidase [Bacillus sp. AK128]